MPEPNASPVWFRLCGLVFRSPFLLPGAVAMEPRTGECADVEILSGPVSVRFPEEARYASEYLIHASQVILNIPKVGRFCVDGGKRITVDPQKNVSTSELMAYLKGSVLAILLHQRDAMPLHASCVARNGRAVAFLGDSAAGKSTMAALFSARGYDLICDDVLIHSADEAGIRVLPSDHSTKLWHDSASVLQLDNEPGSTDPTVAKKLIPTDAAEMTDVHRLAGLFVLSWIFPLTAGPEIRPVSEIEAFSKLRQNIFRDQLVDALDLEGRYMSRIARLISTVPVFTLARPPDYAAIDEIPDLVADRVGI